jgi:hypothetical protein
VSQNRYNQAERKKVKKKVKRTHKNKNIYIYLSIAAAIVVITFSAIQQTQKPPIQQVAAADYFQIRNAVPTAWDETRGDEDNFFITQLRFNLTAIGGDAHNIVIAVPGSTVPVEEWFQWDELKHNATLDVTLPQWSPAYYSRKNEDGYFPFILSLDCDEATGDITFFLEE